MKQTKRNTGVETGLSENVRHTTIVIRNVNAIVQYFTLRACEKKIVTH